MRNAPSFIGEFPSKHKPKRHFSPPSSELPIEKEANLREKKKKILQRLKKNVEPGDAIEVASRPVQEKVVFSPRTSKKFHQATQQLAESTSSNGIKRLDRAKNPLIVLQKAKKEDIRDGEETTRCHGDSNRRPTHKLELLAELRNEDEHVDSAPYVPSFTEKPKRHAAKSVSRDRKQDKVSEPLSPTNLKKTSDFEVSSYKNENESNIHRQRNTEEPRTVTENDSTSRAPKQDKVSEPLSPTNLKKTSDFEVSSYKNENESNIHRQRSTEVPRIVTENDNTNIEFFSDDDNNFDSYTGSPFRRSASFHSLKDKQQEEGRQIRTSAGKRRQFLKVDDYNFTKASSLSSLYDNSSTPRSEGELTTSSTSFAKQQQQKLEDDFHRVEEDLNRAFSELRRYLRTS